MARRGPRGLHRQPARQRRDREPAAPGAQVGAGRANALLLTDIPAASRFTGGIHQRGYSFDAAQLALRARAQHGGSTASRALVPRTTRTRRRRCRPRRRPGRQPIPIRRSPRCPTGAACSSAPLQLRPKLPEPMRPRARRSAHRPLRRARSGTSATTAAAPPRVHYVNRWRLEKKDPAAALSEPKQPIVFWIDRNVPEQVPRRRARRHPRVEQGVRADRLQGCDRGRACRPPTPTVDTSDARHSTVRWFVGADAGFAHRPVDGRPAHRRDPRRRTSRFPSSGRAATARSCASRAPPAPGPRSTPPSVRSASTAAVVHVRDRRAGRDASSALDLLDARGEIDARQPGGRGVRRWRASRPSSCTRSATRSACATTSARRPSTRCDSSPTPSSRRENGIAGSVMDYNAGQHRGEGRARRASTIESTLGPVRLLGDRVRVRAAPNRRPRPQELAQIAARGATDPLLAFSSDEESIAGPRPGGEPVRPRHRSARLPAKRAQALARAVAAAAGAAARSRASRYDVLRRSFDAGFRQVSARAAARRQVRRRRLLRPRLRRHRAQLPLTPVPPDKQRAALDALSRRRLLGRQLPLQARVPAQHGRRLPRHRTRRLGGRVNPDFSLSRARARAAGGRARTSC